MFEIAEWHCGGIESITANTKADANAIKVIDNTGKSCSTHIYLIDGEYIKEDPKSFSFTDIVEKHEKKTHKIFTFDINGDGIDDKVITHINKLNSSGSGYQGNDLVVYLGVPNDKYMLSLNSINYTEDGLFYFSSLSPRTNSTGFILSTYFGSRGYPYKDYYFTLDNDEWKIAKVIVKGYMGNNAFYCEHLTDYNVSSPTAEPEDLEVQNSENDILGQCPSPPTKYTVISEKAEILTEDFESRSSPNYYIKGDSIEAVNQNEDWVQVSYKNGTKFGWIDKRDLTPIPN
ncbi:SH3-like domain-containing protein [Psychrobacter sp. FME5]|nr:SH3-like domain-containing protein [Psychrobacter sp. FME6]MBE0444402.1 SH3-like domain-containing protein [Psychrobacter sp. FME5]